ncbi:hypothetical protein ASG48_03960 [Aurantimonas sp. Leaf443]|nr:hypothetical protein ASG48_03960 [Aurantimonas sp. Leaf443]
MIERLSPDILALQEVDGRSHLGRRAGAFEFFLDALGGHVAQARTVPRPGRDHGHLLWSRFPLEEVVVHVLPGPGLERRAAIEAVVAGPHGPLRVIAVHLGLIPRARANQSAFLAARMAESAEPVAVTGDFNDWRLSGSVHRRLAPLSGESLTPPSFPARRPILRFDRLYLRGAVRLVRGHVDAEARASDHRPLVADLDLS